VVIVVTRDALWCSGCDDAVMYEEESEIRGVSREEGGRLVEDTVLLVWEGRRVGGLVRVAVELSG